MLFEWKLSFDTILTAASFIVFITLYVANMRNASKIFSVRLQQIDEAIDDFKIDIEKLNKVITDLASQNVRIDNVVQMSLGTGQRVDALTNRFNRFVERRLIPDEENHG